MSGVTPLVDTLLATRLGQRVDLVPLKGQGEIAKPSTLANIEKVVNDVRRPSRDALQRQLGATALLAPGDGRLASLSGKPDGPVTLSAAARAVSAILSLPAEGASAVRGVAPLWPERQPPVVSLLVANLARAVAGSGLFYESHLQQYLSGMRTRAQVAQEPQAGLPAAGKVNPGDSAVRLSDPTSASGGVARPVDTVPSTPVSAASLSAVAVAAAFVQAPAGRTTPGPGSGKPPAEGAPASPSPGAALHSDAGDLATVYGRTAALPNQYLPFHEIAGQASAVESSKAGLTDALRAGNPVAAIHPEAMTLVRQQLDLLAMPVFRWTGEGWPGVPMDWELRQEREEPTGQDGRQDRTAEGGTDAAPSAWTTRMTLTLPRLGTVDVRLGLAGATLQLRLDASQDSTVAELTGDCAGLSQRFGAVGLDLMDVQIGRTERTASAAEHAVFPGGAHAG